MQWDFWSLNPESAHQVTYLMGDRGIPKTYRHMNGYGSHTFLWVNAAGEKHWIKYHFHSNQGVEGLSDDEATRIAGEDADFHRRDLSEAIATGDFPSWTLSIQAMPYEDAKTYRFNPFDLTKIWPHSDYPLIKVGTMTLNRNPENFFAQIEQAAFEPSALVPGIGFSPDKMLLGRAFAYADTHRHRIGANYLQLPVNRPHVEVNTYTQDGPMAFEHRSDDPVYAPNSFGRGYADEVGEVNDSWETDGAMVRQAYTLREADDDFGQAGTLVREVWDDEIRANFVKTVAGHLLGGVEGDVLERAFEYWKSVDADTGKRIEELVREGIDAGAPGAQPGEAKQDASSPVVEDSTHAAT
jgi:catalase